MKTVLFACIHNAGRSQMAAAFFNAMANPKLACGISAGTKPGDRVHPEVVQVMAEVGIDLNSIKPRLLTNEMAHSANLLVTMGCGEACPFIPGLKKEDWPLEDPKNQTLEKVKIIREEIRKRVEKLISQNEWA